MRAAQRSFVPFLFAFAAIATIITHDLLPSGFVAQSVEQQTIDSRRGQGIFSLPRAIPHFLTRANAQWEIHLSTLTYTAELILSSTNCFLSIGGTIFICTLQIVSLRTVPTNTEVFLRGL